MTTLCPTCKHPMPGWGGVLVNKAMRIVTYRGLAADTLTGVQLEVFDYLLSKRGVPISREAIHNFLYQLVPGERGRENVPVNICKMRPKLLPLGIKIRNVNRSGYFLELPE